jgi:hypothetical protein
MFRKGFMSEGTAAGLALWAVLLASPASADSKPPRKVIVEIVAALRIGAFDCPGAIDGSLSEAALILMASADPPLGEDEIARKKRQLEAVKKRLGREKWCDENYKTTMALAQGAVQPATAK